MEEIVLRLHEIIKAGLPEGVIKRYYIGAPDTRTDRVMPSIETEVTDMDFGLGPTGMDTVLYHVDMYVVFAKKQGVRNAGGMNDGEDSRAGYKQMMDLIHGTDSTGTYVTYKKSIMKILREHIFLSSDTINTTGEISFNNNIRVSVLPSDSEQSYFAVRISMKINQLIQINHQ